MRSTCSTRQHLSPLHRLALLLAPQLYLQWLRDSTVVSTTELTPLTTMDALGDPNLSFERGRWTLVTTGYQGSDLERTMVFELGPPDQVRLLGMNP